MNDPITGVRVTGTITFPIDVFVEVDQFTSATSAQGLANLLDEKVRAAVLAEATRNFDATKVQFTFMRRSQVPRFGGVE